MGVKFDRILDAFDGPFEKVGGLLPPSPAAMEAAPNPAGYLISHRVNNSFIVVNRLLKANCDVFWLEDPRRPRHLARAPSGFRSRRKRGTCWSAARRNSAWLCRRWPRRPPAPP